MKDKRTVSSLAVYTLQTDLSGGIELYTGKAMFEQSKLKMFKISTGTYDSAGSGTHTENSAENNIQMPTYHAAGLRSLNFNIHLINVMTIIYNDFAILCTAQANAHITTGGTTDTVSNTFLNRSNL